MWLDHLPSSLVFFDVETTGLTDADRVISFGAIWVSRDSLCEPHFPTSHMHLIFNPERPSHPAAGAVHGYADGMLGQQDTFGVWAEDIHRFLRSADMVVAHNISYDAMFVSRELQRAGLSGIGRRQFCTMEAAKSQIGHGKLDTAIAEMGLTRTGRFHGALEDALLAMQLYLWLNGCPHAHAVDLGANLEPFNMQAAGSAAINRESAVSTGRTRADAAEAQRIGQVVDTVNELKRTQDWAMAERMLLLEIARQERDAKASGLGVAPWYYEQLAIVYARRQDYEMELAVLERYDIQPKAPGAGPVRLKDRLERARSRMVRMAG